MEEGEVNERINMMWIKGINKKKGEEEERIGEEEAEAEDEE